MDFIRGNFDFLKENYSKLFTLADEMESKVYYDPGASVIAGNKFFESLIKLIYKIENLEYNVHSMKSNVYRLRDYGVYDFSVRKIFNDTREARNSEIHSDELSDKKIAYKLCALSFQCACWFYNKYSDNKVDCSKFDKELLLDKNLHLSKGAIDKNEIKQIVKETVLELLPKSQNSEDNPIELKEENSLLNDDEIISKFSLKNPKGSFLLNELSKLNKSSNKSVNGFTGFKDNFDKYMHVDRGIESDFKDKLIELSDKSKAQLIFLVGSVGDGKSHLLSYMKSDKEHSKLIQSYSIHGDASESFAHNVNEIRTLESILDKFSDENYDDTTDEDNMIVAINLGTLSNFIEDEQVKSKFKELIASINNSHIFNSDFLTYITTDNFLTVINFSDYQLFELNNGYVTSKFISNLLNKITSDSEENSFYHAYKLDLKKGYKTPIIYNYEMLKSEDVKQIIVQNLIKYNIKNKKQISARNILHFIYQILVPSEINEYDSHNVHEYLEDLLPVLLFKSINRSKILERINIDFSNNFRNKRTDKFITASNTSSIKEILDKCFKKSPEFSFFRNYLLSENYQDLDLDQKRNVLSYLPYFALLFGKEHLKNAFEDEFYGEYIKYLYNYNNNPSKIKELFKKIKKAMFIWKGSVKKGYILIEDLPDFIISKEMDIMHKPPLLMNNISSNLFKKEISFKVFEGSDNYCSDSCIDCKSNPRLCVNLNVDYLLFEYIMKMNEGYRPNRYEKENLVLFEDFISELISQSNDQVLIHNKRNNHEFKFKKLPNGEYKLRRE